MTVYQAAAGPMEMLREGNGQDSAVLLHAAASGPRALFKLAAALGRAGLSTGSPALHGYGATHLDDALPADPFGAHMRVARWAVDQMQPELAHGRRVLIGHSMGGTIALLMALSVHRLDALILYEPIVLDCLDPNDPADVAARAWDGARIEILHASTRLGDPETGVAAFVEAYNEVAWTELPEPLRSELVAKAPNLVAETTAAQQLTLDRQALAELPMPVLILQGSRSPVVTHRMTAGLARAIPHAVTRIVEGAGHMGPVTSHAAVAAQIVTFMKSLST